MKLPDPSAPAGGSGTRGHLSGVMTSPWAREFLNYPVIRQSFAIWTLASDASRAASLDYEDLRTVEDLAAAEDAGWTRAATADLKNEYVQATELMVDAAVRSSWLVAVRILPTLRNP